jgi:hypothetical protein
MNTLLEGSSFNIKTNLIHLIYTNAFLLQKIYFNNFITVYGNHAFLYTIKKMDLHTNIKIKY